MHASLQSQPEAPRPDSNTRESSPSGPVLATDKYSVSVDASGVKAHPTPCLAPDEPRTDLEQGVPAWRYVLQRNPAHLMTPPVAPSRTLDFVLGCGLFERPSDSEAIRQTIERNANSLENVVLRINSERQKLRQSVAVAARHCVDAAYGGHFAQVGLAPMMIFYKVCTYGRVSLRGRTAAVSYLPWIFRTGHLCCLRSSCPTRRAGHDGGRVHQRGNGPGGIRWIIRHRHRVLRQWPRQRFS